MHAFIRVMLLLCGIAATGVQAQAPASSQPAPVTAPTAAPTRGHLFAVIYRKGPGWKTGLPMAKQALGEHLKYYRRGLREGRVFAAGGLIAVDGGLAILTVPSLWEAQAFVAADPAVLNGTFIGDVQAWTVPFVSSAPLKP